jgi:cytoskeletal protein RodZ
MPLGSQLRETRERVGLSIEQISQRTRFQLYEIAALENDSLTHLPDESYVEGLIRAYTAAVGVDSAPVIERVRIERQAPEDKWDGPLEPIVDLSADSQPQATPDTQLHSSEAATEAARPVNGHRVPAAARSPRGRLWLPLLSVLAVSGWAAYFLESGVFKRQATASSPAVVATRPAEVTPARLETAVAVAPTPVSASPAAPIVNNVSGRWTLSTRVESARVQRLSGLQREYQIELDQKGNRVTGTGRRISENAAAIDLKAQTPIRVAGRMKANELILSFTEGSRRRGSSGGFAMRLDDRGNLRGRFSSNVPQTAGTAEAQRVK